MFPAKVVAVQSVQMEQTDLVVEEVDQLPREKIAPFLFQVGTVSLSFATKPCCKSFQNVVEKNNDVKRNEFKIIVTCKCIYPSRAYMSTSTSTSIRLILGALLAFFHSTIASSLV